MDEKKIREAIEQFNKELKACDNLIRKNSSLDTLCLKMIKEKEYIRTAIEALEKQLTKDGETMRIDCEDDLTVTFEVCPVCRQIRSCGDYCPRCGQKLDWSE